jgi:hypothetical protein
LPYFGAKYRTRMNRCLFFALLLLLACCRTPQAPESADVWKKIKLDFKELDAEGLTAQGKSKVALNYEFCIPTDDKHWKAVKKIDPTAQKNGGRGRAGCKEGQWLVIGSTHQKNYQRVLYELASLPFVGQILPVFWE